MKFEKLNKSKRHFETRYGISSLSKENLYDQLSFEIEKRLEEIKELAEEGIWQKMTKIVQKKFNNSKFLAASGEELYKMHQTKAALECYERVLIQPKAMRHRLDLVRVVQESGREFSLNQLKNIFLQAIVAPFFGELNTSALKIILAAQNRYFTRLIEIGTRELKQVERQELKIGSKSEVDQAMKRLLETNLAFLKQSIQLSKKLPEASSRDRLKLEELEEYFLVRDHKVLGGPQANKFRKAACRNFQYLRPIQFLHNEGLKYLLKLQKLEPKEPVFDYLHAKILFSKLLFLYNQHYHSIYTKEDLKEIRGCFLEINRFYEKAIRKIGTMPKESIMITILCDYGQFVHYCYLVLIKRQVIVMKPEQLIELFERAVRVMQRAPENLKSVVVIEDLQRDLREIELRDAA